MSFSNGFITTLFLEDLVRKVGHFEFSKNSISIGTLIKIRFVLIVVVDIFY